MRKQAGQLPSKMRFVAAQFEALLNDDLWLRNAAHANAMARRWPTAEGTAGSGPHPEVNSVFAPFPPAALEALQAWSFFRVWDEATTEVRWMTSFDTTEADIDTFLGDIRSTADLSRRVPPMFPV